MRADQERVRELLTDTVTLLCKNGLHFDTRLRIEGVLGITVDETHVFIVHINESLGTNENGQNVISGSTHNVDTSSSKSERVEPQPYHRSTFKHRRRMLNQQLVQSQVSKNESQVSKPTVLVRDCLMNESVENNAHVVHPDHPTESDCTKDAHVINNVPITDQSKPVVKSEILYSDSDRASVIDLDNDEETEVKFESHCSQSGEQLSNSSMLTAFEKESSVQNVLSPRKRPNHVSRRYKLPAGSPMTTESNIATEISGESEDCKTFMGINEMSFNSGDVRSFSDTIKERSNREAGAEQLNDDSYWHTNMDPNVDDEFGIASQSRSSRFSYFDSSRSDRNNSLFYPSWQVSSSRRSSTSVQKPYKCPHAGCGLRFYHRNNVSRHCTLKHGGAGVRQRSVYPTPYEACHDASQIYSDSNITYDDPSLT